MSKGYLCLDPTTNKIYTTCYALFNESVFPFADRPDLTAPNVPFSSPISDSAWFSINSNVSNPSSTAPSSSLSPLSSFPDSFHLALLQSDSCNSDSQFFPSSSPSSVPALPLSVSSKSSSSILVNNHPMVTRSKLGIHKPKVLKVGTDYTFQEPTSFTVAVKYPQWKAAMDSEFSSLLKQQTWSLVPPPIAKNIVTCKWVYKIKRHIDGSIVRYKARLVARGYLQQYAWIGL